MPTLATSPSRPARTPAIAATLAVHVVLVALWLGAQAPRPHAAAGGPRIQWIDLPPPARVPAPKTTAVTAPSPARAPVRGAAAAMAKPPLASVPVAPSPSAPGAPPATPLATSAPSAVPPTTSAPADAAPARSGADVLAQARRDIGKIAGQLGKESPGLLRAPISNAQTRLAAGIDGATRAPGFFEAPRVELVQDQGGYDRRIYKVKGALGTYCITVESNHAPDGLDAMKRGIQQKIMQCPREE